MSKVRILTIDGGGIKGIIPATILQIIEEKIQIITGDPEARLIDFLDFIAGSSTGAIIGCGMLAPSSKDPGRPQYRLKEIVDWYHQKGEEIFSKPFLHKLKSLWGVLDEKYPNTALKAALKEQFGDILMSGLLKPCMVTAYEIEARKSMFITQQDAADSPDADFLVRDALLASSAAPTFFEAVKIPSLSKEDHVLIDGGVFANNPAMCAYAEVRKLTFGDLIHPTSNDMLLISLGTGYVDKGYPYEKAKNFGFVNWVRPLISILMSGNAETVSYQLSWLFDAGLNSENFIRVEPDLLHAKVDMDDASATNRNALHEAALHYVAQNEALIDEIVLKLVKNS